LVNIEGTEVLEGLYYTKDFEWMKIEGEKVRIGITDYAQKQLREIVYAELPSVNDALNKNDSFGSVESVKAVSDLVAPVTGTIEEINEEVQGKPEILNEDPYGKGWLVVLKTSNLNAELADLMDFNQAVEWHKSLSKEG